MKKILAALLLIFFFTQAKAQTPYTAPWGFNYAAPTAAPSALGTHVRLDISTGRVYQWSPDALNWQLQGYTIEQISGSVAPAYTPVRGQSWFVVNNDTLPRLYQYTGSGTAWKCLNCSSGKTYTAGEGVNIYGNTIQLDTLDRLSFAASPVLPGGVGTIRWNDTDGCLEYGMKGGTVVQQIGLEQLTLVKHADNTGLTLGKVVYFVGSDGTNKTVRYALANAESTSANTFGIMAESATGGNKAFCTTFGLVTGLNTLSLSEGNMVWLSESSAGDMTTMRPTAPNHAVQIGYCIRSHATQGIIFVSVQNGYELEELHNVSSTTPTAGQVLKWDGTVWKPDTDNNTGTTYTAGTGISISGGNVISNTGDLSATNELQNLSLAGQSLGISSGTGVTLPIIDVVAGTGITVSKTAGAATVNSSGITSLTGDVTATGPGSVAATITNSAVTAAKLAAGAVSDSLKIANGAIQQSNIANGAVWAKHIARMGATNGQILGWNGSIWGPTTITGTGITSLNGLTAGTQTFATSTTGTDFTISSSVAAHTFNLPTASATNRGALSTTDWSTFNAKVGGSGSAGQVAYFSAGSTLAGNSNLFWNNSTGRLGIGTSSPGALLQVNGNTWVNRIGINIDPSALGATRLGILTGSNTEAIFRAYNSTGATRIAWDLTSDVPSMQFIGSSGTITVNPGSTTTFGAASSLLLGGTGSSSGKLHVIGTNSSVTYTLWLANSSAAELFKIRDDGRFEVLATNTATGTTGAQTINRPTGTVNFAAGTTSLTVTNNLCQTTSIVMAVVRTNDATAVVKNVVPASGSFTINLTAAATAETSVGFWIIN